MLVKVEFTLHSLQIVCDGIFSDAMLEREIESLRGFLNSLTMLRLENMTVTTCNMQDSYSKDSQRFITTPLRLEEK